MKRMLAAAFTTSLLLVAPSHALAGDHARIIEAYADKGFDKSLPVRISPLDAKQAADPLFRSLAGELVDQLSAQGFKVVAPRDPSDYIVTLEYQTYNTNLRASTESSVDDPSYRMVIVSAWNIADPKAPKLKWQTAIDSYGISMNPATVVPAMLKAGATSFGQAKTPKGLNKALWCSDGVPVTGRKISPVCDTTAERPQLNYGGLLTGLTAYTPAAPGG